MCRDPQCWKAGLEPRKLAHALKCPVMAGQVASIQALIEASLAGDALAEGSPAAVPAMDLGEQSALQKRGR